MSWSKISTALCFFENVLLLKGITEGVQYCFILTLIWNYVSSDQVASTTQNVCLG